MSKNLKELGLIATDKPEKHPKCKGYTINTPDMYDFDCGYNTSLECDECKYGLGRKDPEAKVNQL